MPLRLARPAGMRELADGREFVRRARPGARGPRPGDGISSGSPVSGTENKGVMAPGCGRADAAARLGTVGSGSIGGTFLSGLLAQRQCSTLNAFVSHMSRSHGVSSILRSVSAAVYGTP